MIPPPPHNLSPLFGRSYFTSPLQHHFSCQIPRGFLHDYGGYPLKRASPCPPPPIVPRAPPSPLLFCWFSHVQSLTPTALHGELSEGPGQLQTSATHQAHLNVRITVYFGNVLLWEAAPSECQSVSPVHQRPSTRFGGCCSGSQTGHVNCSMQQCKHLVDPPPAENGDIVLSEAPEPAPTPTLFSRCLCPPLPHTVLSTRCVGYFTFRAPFLFYV